MRAIRAAWPWLKQGWTKARTIFDLHHLAELLDAARDHIAENVPWAVPVFVAIAGLVGGLPLWLLIPPVVILGVYLRRFPTRQERERAAEIGRVRRDVVGLMMADANTRAEMFEMFNDLGWQPTGPTLREIATGGASPDLEKDD